MVKKKVCGVKAKDADRLVRGSDLETPVSAGEVVENVSSVLLPTQNAMKSVSQNRDAGHRQMVSQGTVLRRSPRPSGCSRFVRREIADAMPSICAMLLTRVMDGDLASLKLLLQMAASGQSTAPESLRRPTGFGRKILVGFKEFEARESGLRREG